MKRILLLLLMSASFFSLEAQEDMEGGVYGEFFQLGDRSQTDFGVMLYIPVKERFTLNYQIGIGLQQRGGLYLHAPAVAVAGTYLLAHSANWRGLGALGALALVIPEGVGMYVNNSGVMPVHLSVNPLGCDYWYRRDSYEEFWKMSCSAVARFKMTIKLGAKGTCYFSPYVAGTMIYTPGDYTERFGFRAGATLGFDKNSL